MLPIGLLNLEEDEFSLAKKLVATLSEIGFVYVTSHGLQKKIIDDAFYVSKQFFSLPFETKLIYKRAADNLGYVQLGQENLNPSNVVGDYKEALNFIPQVDSNRFPDKLVDGFSDIFSCFYEGCVELANKLLYLISVGLEISPDIMCKSHSFSTTKNQSTVRALYYPPVPDGYYTKPEGQGARCGEHSDYGSITLLFQDDVGGLEVFSCEKEWIKAPHIPGTILVNIGDLMQRWTADKLVSTKHRVMMPSVESAAAKTARQSIAFFCHPDDDFPVSCVDGSMKYPTITGKDYLDWKFSLTY